ncbi:hypothetical protein CTHBC1_1465 [Acetivibrio thermocellus BC1]|nr:hypothetical protein CTHBC1_1465 [Acetivibrio thermocellus BC1]
MYEFKRLSEVFESAEEIPFDDFSKIIIMSDCHRGDGSWADNFSKNKNIYYAALTYYYRNNFTYIELGDGDELWENDNICDIISEHRDVFSLLTRFIDEGRAYFIYGNHDIEKKKYALRTLRERKSFKYLEDGDKRNVAAFFKTKVHEGLILRHRVTGDKIFLVHGHQADFANDKLWRVSKFFVRYLWRPLELLGIRDPNSASKNDRKKTVIANKIVDWVKSNNQMIVAGHTHRAVFPAVGQPPYFNDGCCVHPYGITGIEIVHGKIALVKWSVKTKDDGTLYVGRDEIEKPVKLKEYFR